MPRLLLWFPLFFLLGCAPEDTPPDTGSAAEDTATDTGTETDTGTPIPEWVDPVVPEGPIPGPEGSSDTPEEGDFDWTGIGTQMIEDTLPTENLGWKQFPQYGDATLLDWSDSEECVCFDVDLVVDQQSPNFSRILWWCVRVRECVWGTRPVLVSLVL